MKIRLLALALIFIFSAAGAFAQSGVRFDEFKKRIEPYFADELISDIEKEMPEGNYTIWGWDVGDFSDDGFYDVAFSTRVYSDRRKVMQIFMFVDIDGFLVKVAQVPVRYYELPLETGVMIKNNACYITKKNKRYDWDIIGYTFDNGALIKLDEFNTERVKRLTHETYTNYKTLQNTEKYFYTSNKKVKFQADYLTIPSYERGKFIYKGYSAGAYISKVEYVPSGAYYWNGEEDLSYTVSSAYDKDFLYMKIKVKDDIVSSFNCTGCWKEQIEVWFDTYKPGKKADRFMRRRGKNIVFREKADSGIYNFVFSIGDFLEEKASLLELNTNETLEDYRKKAVNEIMAVSDLTEDGYVIRFRIPFIVFGFENAPLQDNPVFGFTAIVHDIDNAYRPKEATIAASSSFDSDDPKTFGRLELIPSGKWYGEKNNIYKKDIVRYLSELGF